MTGEVSSRESPSHGGIDEILECLSEWHQNSTAGEFLMLWKLSSTLRLPLGLDDLSDSESAHQLIADKFGGKTTDLVCTVNSLRGKWANDKLVSNANGLWVDVDTYRNGIQGPDIWEYLQAIDFFNLRDLPFPSQVISSGRGIYLLWLLEARYPFIDYQAREIFSRVQSRLVGLFADIGAWTLPGVHHRCASEESGEGESPRGSQ